MTLYGKWAKQAEKKRDKIARQERMRRDWLIRSIAAATTFTFFSPAIASADIVSGNDAITTVDKQNNIYTVESHKYFGNSAVNWFSQFGLGANEIANLYFGTQTDNSKLNLFNFVDSRIDVNGTVNAIQNNTIGGNLFFLSKDGIAVGSTGVINAGSLTLLTPSEDYYEKFIEDGGWNSSMDADVFAEELPNLQGMNIPLNPTGEIVVKGKFYAPNGIQMKAASIALDSTAHLKTGTIDFGDLVNAGTTNNTVFNGSQDLTVEKTADGDIVLSAYSDVRNKKDAEFTQTILGITSDEETLANNNTIEASVTSKGTIDAAGDVTITAEAANGQEFYAGKFSEPSGLGTNETAAYQIAQSVAKIDIADGTVSGQQVTISADADNSYIDNDSLVKMIAINAIGAITVNMDAAYAVLDGKASVNIGQPAVVEAKSTARTDSAGKAVDALSITANSRVQGSVGATTAAVKLSNIKGSNILPSTAVSYIETANEAKVNIDGTLKSAGNTRIEAATETQMNATAASKTTSIGESPESIADIAVVVGNGSANAEVTIGENAKMTHDDSGTNLDGDLTISATTENQVHTTAAASGGDGALGATAVNVTTYDSSADVTIGASIEAEDISVTAGNAISDNTATADNEMGSSSFMAMLGDSVATSATVNALTDDLLPKLAGLLPEKIEKAILAPPDTNFASEVGKMFSIGASVTVAEEVNHANITVKEAAAITARGTTTTPSGDVSLIANNNILDTKMSAIGKTNNNGRLAENKALVSAGVLVADIDNDADVIIEGKSSADVGNIRGGDITMTATNTMVYNRTTAMIGELLWAIAKIEAAFNLPADYRAEMDEFKQMLAEAQDAMASDPNYLENTEFLDLALNLGQAADQLVLDAEDLGLYNQLLIDGICVFDIFTKAASFTDLNNYSNFTVNNTTGGKKFEEAGATTSVAGNLNLATVSHTGRVLVGKNTVIDAAGKLDIAANGDAQSVNVTGGLPGGTHSKVGLGGSFSLQRYDVENVTMLAEGAKLSGSAIDISSENDVVQVGVVTQSGLSGSVAINGMVNMMMGDSNSLIFIDDEASLSATEASSGTITAGENDGSITISALNDTVITNVAGGFSMGDNVSVGVGLALTDYTVNNMAGIVDNDHDTVYEETDETDGDASAKRQNSVAQAMQAARAASGLTNEQSAALFGSGAQKTSSTITANSLYADALTEGVVNSVSVAGSVAITDDSGEPGMFDKLTNWFKNTWLIRKIKKGEDWAIGQMNKLDGKIGGAIHDKYGSDVSNQLNTATTDQGGGNNTPDPNTLHTQSINIAGAGSASVNLLDKNTGALIEGANITLHQNANNSQGSSLSVNAKDKGFVGAWSGSAGVAWKTTTIAENRQSSVGIAGAVGMNLLEGSVQSAIADSALTNVDTITNAAASEGAAAAAGLGATVTIADGSQVGGNISIAGAMSMNDVDNSVYALMEDDTVSRTDGDDTQVTVSAFSGDIQVTGGVNATVAAGGSTGSSVGGAVTVSDLANDVQAGISGGTYTNIGSTEISSLLATKQVSGAVGVGVQAGSDRGFAFEGAAVYNTIDDRANAFIDGATITADTVAITAKDTIAQRSEWETYINERGLEADGKSVQDNAASIDEVGEFDADGTLIVSAALSVAGSGGTAGAAGAVAIDEITNDRTSSITNSNIKAGSVNVGADADSLLVSSAAGGGGGSYFGGVGSVSWHNVENDVTATIDKSTITANTADVLADNGAILVNVAGQVSAAKSGVAVGAALAYQGVDNMTGAYITGSTLQSASTDDGISVSANGMNRGEIITVGAGVTATGGAAAVNGTVAVNRGANDTEAIIGKSADGTRSAVTDAKSIQVKASDNTNLVAVAGGVGASKTAAVGGAVAYNDIGGSALSTERATQNLTAGIDDTDITTKASDTVITAEAEDDADITTVAVGIGGSGTVAVEGASATSLINKTVAATMTNTNIDKDTADASRADVTVSADSKSDIISNASVIAGSGTAAIGAGVSVNRIQQDTSAILAGGKQNVNGLLVKSISQPTITATGIGGSGAGTVGIAGSVAVNLIEDNSIAKITDGAEITAGGSVGVISENDQVISNYVGAASGAGTVAIGASVSVNEISGSSDARVEDAKVTAKGSTDYTITTNSQVADDAIVDKIFTQDTIDPTYNLKDKRQTETNTGLVVDSSSTHNLRSLVVTAGGSGAVAVEGTVNVNMVEGSTTAGIDNSVINGNGASEGTDDVTVRARDYTNSTGLVGSAAGSMYAAVAPASDTNLVDRTVRAEVIDSDTTDTVQTTIYGDDVAVSADSKQGISSFGAGAALAVEGAGVSGVISVTTMDGVTEAIVDQANIEAQTSSVTADHLSRANVGNANGSAALLGGGVGASICISDDDSVTRAVVTSSTIDVSGDNTVTAANRTELNQDFLSAGIAVVGGGVAASVVVNNIDNTAEVTAADSMLEGSVVTVKANNQTNLKSNGGTAAIGLVGGGVGANVTVNTIDSQTTVTTDSAAITATDDVMIVAEETRNIVQNVGNASAGGIVGIGGNVMVTNIGKTIDETNMTIDTIEQTAADGTVTETDVDIKSLIDMANEERIDDFGDYTIGLTEAEDTAIDAAQGEASYGSGNSLVATKLIDTEITAGDVVAVSAQAAEAIDMTGGSFSGSAASLLGTVGVLNLHHNVMTNITDGSQISAGTISAAASVGDLDGKGVRITTLQGAAGAASIGAAVAIANTEGKIALNAGNATMKANEIILWGEDTTSVKAESSGLQVGAAAVGAIVAEADNDSSVFVTVADSKLNQSETSGSTVVYANKNNQVSATVGGTTVGVASGVGLDVDASDDGAADTTVTNTEAGGRIVTIRANNTPIVSAAIDNDTYGALAVQVGLADAIVKAQSNLTISGSKLLADIVTVESSVGTDGVTTAQADLVSVNGSAAEGSGNVSTTEVYADAKINVGSTTYKNTTDLTVTGSANTKAETDIESLNIGLLITTGNNKAVTKTQNTTSVTVDGNTAVGSLTVKANGSADNDARADSSGGGAINASEAAHAESHMANNATANVSGSWTVADEAVIEAVQSDRSNVNAYAVRGGAVSGSGAVAVTNITGTANVGLNGNITADTLAASAKNNIQTGDAYDYAVQGDNYGALTVQGNKTDSTINKQTNVAINADITTEKEQTYEALTNAEIKNKSALESVEVVGYAETTTNTDTTVANSITLGEGKTLTTQTGGDAGDITLAASDMLDITAKGVAEIPASAASGATANTTTTTTHSNTININGDLYSLNDINLYAGKDAQSSDSSLVMDTSAEVYNRVSLIPIVDPNLNNYLTQNNQVIVGSSANGESVRHINISANAGEESIREMTGTFTWYNGGTDQEVSYVGTSEGKEMKNKTAANFARIDGALTAGTQNTQNIVISGYVAPPNTKVVEGTSDANYTITLNGETMTDATVGTMDYGNMLFDRYQTVTNLMNEYKGKYEESGSTKDLSAYLGYKAEQERILSQMSEMGMVVTVTENGTTTYFPSQEGYQINVVEIGDVVSSGGNITVNTDTLYGGGSVTAQGSPQISIQNQSTAYLKLNDVTIGELGGEVIYNGHSIGDNDTQTIKTLNQDQTASVAFGSIATDDASGQEAKIDILSTDVGTMKIESTLDEETEGTSSGAHEWSPIKTIEIDGVISNLLGTAAITNEAGDIVLQSGEEAGIEAKVIKLSATGSLMQGYTDGIVNIGGNPEAQWQELAESKQQEAEKILSDNSLENETHDVLTGTIDTDTAKTENSAWIVGGEVYINASDINVNGTIQSGFGKYQVTIADGDIMTDESKTAYINGTKVYKINEGNRAVLQDDGTYAYEVQAYYDPSADKIIIDDIESSGGKVYLTGRISSTGNGKIVALDGGAEIEIISTANKDIEVGMIKNDNADGFIRITDLAQMTETEYTNGQTKKTDLITGETTTRGNSTVYEVKEGLRYNWTTGTETTEEKTYQNDVKEGMWGLYEVDNETALVDYEKENTPTETLPEETRDKMEGVFIDTVDEIGTNGSDYVLIYDNEVKSNERSDVEEWTSTSGFLGWYHWTHYRWTVTTGSSQTYQHSIKADHDIGIEFINGANDQSINIIGAQNVDLGGSITTAADAASLMITAGGSITQANGTTITGNDIDMSAQTGIAGINAAAMQRSDGTYDVYTKAQTMTGDIDITLDGEMKIDSIKTGSGTVSLTATDDIEKLYDSSSLVSGDRIDLTSGGAIDMEVQTSNGLSVNINAFAKGDISLTQNRGDMRVETITSQQGDVTLTVANGYIVDALPTETAESESTIEARIQQWRDLGLIEGEGAFTRSRAKDAEAYRTNITEAYAHYAEQKAYYEQNPTEAQSELYLILHQAFADYNSADAFLAAQEQDATSQYYDLTKTLTAADYEWTKEHLLYALHDSVINKTGATPQDKVANITGKNITLTAANGGIGIASDTVEIVPLTTIDGLKRLSTAENSDVEWYEGADNPYTDADGNKHYNVAVISEKAPLGIASSGTVSANARDGIYLAGRESNLEGVSDSLYAELTIDQITSTAGDVRLMGQKALRSVDGSNYHVKGNDIIIEGGEDGIGTTDAPLVVQTAGKLTARSDGEMYIRQDGSDLVIDALYAAEDAAISSTHGILSETDDIGYLNVRGDLMLKAGGDIGSSEVGLRILADGGAVNAAADNIYIDGIAETGNTDNTLTLHDLTASESIVSVQSASSITAEGAITAASDEAVVSLQAEDGIELAAGKIEADNIELTAGTQIVQTAEHTLSGDSVKASAETGISLLGENNSIGALQLDNEAGDITVNNTGAMTLAAESNAGNITVNNTGGTLTLGSSLNVAGENSSIALNNTEADIDLGAYDVTASNEVSIRTNTSGDITGTGTITGIAGNVTLKTDSGNIKTAAVESGADAVLSTNIGSITVGSLTAGGAACATTPNGDITIGTLTTEEGADISVTEGDISIDSLTSNAGASVTAETGNIDVSSLTTEADATVSTIEGNINIDSLDSNAGATVEAETGSIDVGSLATEEDVTVSTIEGDISIDSLDSGAGASVEAETGSIDVSSLTTEEDATVSTIEGNINIDSLDSGAGASVEAETGSIDIDSLTSEQDATVSTTNGDIAIDSLDSNANASVESVTGDINIGSITTEQDASISTNEGDINIDSLTSNANASVEAETGNIDISSLTSKQDATVGTDTGDIALTNIVSDSGNISVTAQTTGDITVQEAISRAGAVELTANQGDIFADTVTAQTSASIHTTVGAIEANRITADDFVSIEVHQQGDITSDDIIQSLNDSVDIYTAKGDVDLNAVYAKQNASVTSGDGNVTIYTIDGENVYLAVENPDKKLSVDTVTAGRLVDITSSKTNIDTIIQRDDHDNMLIISPNSPDPNAPLDYLNINHIITDNGVIFSQLWVDYIHLHVDAEKFYLPKLRIGKVGYFSTNSTSVTLYGIAPWLNDTNIQLWHDANLDEWTNLYFLRPQTIRTDSVYLNGDDWYNVFQERMSGVDMMRMNLMAENSLYYNEIQKERETPYYAPFSRYFVIDDTDWLRSLPPIAADSDILVEETI